MSAVNTWLAGLWGLYGARALNWLSLAVFLGGVIAVCVLRRTARLSSRLLWATAAELFAVMLVEIAESLSPDFPIRTLQAFSLDATYEAMVAPVTAFASSGLNAFFHAYRVLLYCLAPVLGGAVIYDVLAGVSPTLKLLFLRRRRLYVFSALNEKSVLLAEDLHRAFVEEHTPRHPVIVFTACGEDDGEWKQRAEAIRAICLHEDLFHIRSLRRSRRCSFLLMDMDARGEPDDLRNVSALQRLLDSSPAVWDEKRGCAIYVFSNNSEAAENIRSVKARYDAAAGEERARLSVRVVRDYAQSCCGHLHRHPLFEGLKEGEALELVLLGWTPFAREMFKTLFWLGQMTEHPLRIAVVSAPGDGAERALLRACPELLESCTADSPCLRVRAGGDCAAPYASLCFVEADLDGTPMPALLSAERSYQYGETGRRFRLAQARRFFVLLGGDEENIAAAGALRRALTHAQLVGDSRADAKIDVLVENDALRKLAAHRFFPEPDGDALCAPEVLLFGGLARRFCRDVLALDGLRLAEGERAERHALRDVAATKDDIYNDFSRLARAFHLSTKMFCLGAKGGSEYEKKLDFQRRLQPYEQPSVERLRWLEHRRWCAFLRAEGFSAPLGLERQLERAAMIPEADLDALRRYISGEAVDIDALTASIEEASGLRLSDWRRLRVYSHKDVPARLHPCLVECLPCNNDPAVEKDRLDLVETLRLLVKAGQRREKGAPKTEKKPPAQAQRRHREAEREPHGLKKYDAPYGEYGPSLDRAETYAYMSDTQPAETPPTERQWRELLRRWPELERCRRLGEEGRFCLDLLEDYKQEAGRDAP